MVLCDNLTTGELAEWTRRQQRSTRQTVNHESQKTCCCINCWNYLLWTSLRHM